MASHADVIELYWETCWNGRRPDRLAEVFHDPYMHGRKESSPALMAGILEETFGSFPDLRVEVSETRVLDETVITRSTFIGTHGGEIFGLRATGKVVEMATLDVFFFREGKVSLYWHLTDHLPIVIGIGADVRIGDQIAKWD